MDYHLKQWENVYHSTKVMTNFVSPFCKKSKVILDICCGAGAPLSYLAKKNPNVNFYGFDIDKKLIKIGEKKLLECGIKNVSLTCRNVLKLDSVSCDGVIINQSLSWFKDYDALLDKIFNTIESQWVFISSLFYPGEISAKIKISGRYVKSAWYNIYSIPKFERFIASYNYSLVKQLRFELPFDLNQESVDYMGTYTINTLRKIKQKGCTRMQFSGPIPMPWYFLVIKKKSNY